MTHDEKFDRDLAEFELATKGLFIAPDLSSVPRADVSDPPFLPRTFTTEEKLAAVEREIAIRLRVYPGRILTRRMSKNFADEQIAVMQAIADDYRGKT